MTLKITMVIKRILFLLLVNPKSCTTNVRKLTATNQRVLSQFSGIFFFGLFFKYPSFKPVNNCFKRLLRKIQRTKNVSSRSKSYICYFVVVQIESFGPQIFFVYLLAPNVVKQLKFKFAFLKNMVFYDTPFLFSAIGNNNRPTIVKNKLPFRSMSTT